MGGDNVRKHIIKTLALVLVFALILSVAAPPKAAAVSELVIIGGVAMTIGLAVAISMIAADSAGMKDAIINAANDGLVQTGEIMESLLRHYQTARNFRLVNMLALFQAGTKVLQNGAIALGKDLSDFLTGFFDWAWSVEGGNLVASAPHEIRDLIDPASIGFNIGTNKKILYGQGELSVPLQDPTYRYVSAVPYVIYNYSSRYDRSRFTFISESPTTVYRIKIADGSTTTISVNSSTTRTVNGVSYTYYYGGSDAYANYPMGDIWGQSSFDRSSAFNAAYVYFHGYEYREPVSGSYEDPDTNVLQLPAEGAIDTNILNIPDQLVLPAPVSGTASADKYVEAVRDAIYTGAGSLEYTDANDIAGTATLEMTGAATVDQTASAAGSLDGAVDAGVEIGSPTLDNYSIDLRDFFPFCIPFDIYDMLNLLSGSREAPVVRWRFYVPSVVDTEIEIDLSPFDPVAQVLRTVELLAFALALAFGTKKLLMGS